MIRIHLDVAVAVYLGVSIAVLVLWMLLERGRAGSPPGGSPGTLWECPICFSVYVDSRSESISTCPVCGALHRRGEKSVHYSEVERTEQLHPPGESG